MSNVENSPAEQIMARGARRRRRRMLVDQVARHGITAGGSGVIIAIALIFFYLLYVVYPLFIAADAQPVVTYGVPGMDAGETLVLALEEQAEVAVRVTDKAQVVFFDTRSGDVIDSSVLPLPADARLTSHGEAVPETGLLVLGFSNGEAVVFRHRYKTNFDPEGGRSIQPEIEYPLGMDPIRVGDGALLSVGLQGAEDSTTLAAVTSNGELRIVRYEEEESFLELDDESSDYSIATGSHPVGSSAAVALLINRIQDLLYIVGADGVVEFFNIADATAPYLMRSVRLTPKGVSVVDADFLIGTISLMIAGDDGIIRQWFPVRDEHNELQLHRVREFKSAGGVTAIVPEHRRKGFAALTGDGQFELFNTTAHRNVLTSRIGEAPLALAALSPRADFLLAQEQHGPIHLWALHNEHPDVSWGALWRKVWYENYEKPEYIWQSSAATNDFEPKFSLMPLAFGTLKAAFYAMLFAVPLSVLGAVYTGYFMTARMRGTVKPLIEMMGALPTVVLGFIAGLWLAPVLEANLPGLLAMALLVPLAVLGTSAGVHCLPADLGARLPDGWEAAILVPVVLAACWAAIAGSPLLEGWLFGGDMSNWLTNEMGIAFDQRNSIVVGIAMGVAVIPNIFSIAEDAIFGVPRHLTQGSLALGATPWQTLARVVILTASPGIFSAIMIGLGRAVGETMIVLMATGNTPVMDFSIFQGMRTLAANIAVEMPESEVDSTHYRILFLAALVLFLFTFVFNTAAEIVRQRLREKYSNL